MDKNCSEICRYRMGISFEDYAVAEDNVGKGFSRAAINRAYYSIFHMMNALLFLDCLEFKAHTAVIAKFREKYIKTGIFERNLSDIIRDLFEYRNNSDYADLFVISLEEAKLQVENAKFFIETVKAYIEKRLSENNYSEKGE